MVENIKVSGQKVGHYFMDFFSLVTNIHIHAQVYVMGFSRKCISSHRFNQTSFKDAP